MATTATSGYGATGSMPSSGQARGLPRSIRGARGRRAGAVAGYRPSADSFGGALDLLREQEPVEAPQYPGDLGCAADGEQGAGDVGLGRGAPLVADDESLIRRREDYVGRDHVTGQPKRVHPSPGDGRAARL